VIRAELELVASTLEGKQYLHPTHFFNYSYLVSS
jgi:hypothetical protein